MRVESLVKQIKRDVHIIASDKTVEDAISLMTARNISALIVMENGHPKGIFTERDVLRCHVSHRTRYFREVNIKEAMTKKLIVATPSDSVSSAMAMMIKADIRHLPVTDEQRIISMLSISDLVKHHVGQLTAELHYLQEYITDLQDAVQE